MTSRTSRGEIIVKSEILKNVTYITVPFLPLSLFRFQTRGAYIYVSIYLIHGALQITVAERERELPEEKTLWEMLAERLTELNAAVGLR